MTGVALVSLYGVENNGVRSISSVLQNDGILTSLIFLKRWVNNDIRPPSRKEVGALVSLLKELDVGLVGLSFTSPFLGIAREVTRQIKEKLPVCVVWGGIHASAFPEECLADCDVVCRGEGDYAMRDLAKAVACGRSLAGIDNICYKDDGRVRLQPLRPLIQDLDALPHQDYGGENKFFIDGRLHWGDPLQRAAELRIFASRGCPFACSYCYNSILRSFYPGQRYHRIRKVDTVLAEIASALSRLERIRKIKFDDDTFIFPAGWVREFCEKYPKAVGLPFEVLFNAECPSGEMFSGLKRAGLDRVQVGIQTGSAQKAAEVYDRPLHLERVAALAGQLNELRVEVVYDVILDNPLVSYEDNVGLAEFLLTLPRPFHLFLYSLTVFPGTALCKTMLEKGLITPDEVEGRATKSLRQFRFSFGYPRKREELFIACIISLTSKSFVPRNLIRRLMKNCFLKRHPFVLRLFAEVCNYAKLTGILVRMLWRREAGLWKLGEYATPRRALIQ